jgi:hypothetical protein
MISEKGLEAKLCCIAIQTYEIYVHLKQRQDRKHSMRNVKVITLYQISA